MTDTPVLRSGLVLDLEELMPAVASARRRASPEASAAGVPLHVTLLFPFAPAAELDEWLHRLGQLAASLEPITVTLERVATWPGVVWAAPGEAGALGRMVRTVIESFPAFPPYGGDHPDPVPHATLATPEPRSVESVAETLRISLDGALPARAEVTELTVMEEHAHDRWRAGHRLPLGSGA